MVIDNSSTHHDVFPFEEAYSLIKKTIDGYGHLPENQSIRETTRILESVYQLDKDELVSQQYDLLTRKKLVQKYRPERALSTFITHSVNYGLKERLRRETKQRRLIASLEELQQEAVSGRLGLSIIFLEKLGFDGLVDRVTPEDIIIGKELLALVIDHFGVFDAQVVLGLKSRNDGAERSGIDYDVYRKRLYRKKRAFRAVVNENGYEWI